MFKDDVVQMFRNKAGLIADYIKQNPGELKNDELARLNRLNNALYVVLLDKSGKLIDEVNIKIAEEQFYINTMPDEDFDTNQNVYKVVMPVDINGDTTGKIYTCFNSTSQASELKRKTLLLALFSLSILTFGILFTYLLFSISFKPLKKIISFIDRRMNGDNDSTIKGFTNNELGILAEKISGLLDNLYINSNRADILNKKLHENVRSKIYEIGNEINHRKKTESYLRNSEKQFKQLFENAPIGMLITSDRGVVVNINNAFCQTLGYDANEIVGFSVKRIFTDNDSTEYKPTYKLLLEAVDIDFETTLIKQDGSYIFAIVKSFTLTDERGRAINSLIQILDVTEMRKAQNELTVALEQAKESDRLKSAFLAQMSHEIRTPLNVILPSIPIIADELGSKDEEINMILTSVENAGNRLQRTIDMILSMSAVQSGNYKPKFEVFNIADDLKDLSSEFRTIVAEKGLGLTFNCRTDEKYINADRYTTNQIFQNLIGNAVKYTHSGFIKITLQDSGTEKLIVSVEDSGIGMSPRYIKNLFSPFSQEDTGRTRKYDGNGLGLALVKEYVNINNGQITVESEKNKGSIFSVTLPKASALQDNSNQLITQNIKAALN